MSMVKTIKNAIDTDKITIGTDVTLKSLNQGKLGSVIIAANCPADIKRDIEKAAKLSELQIQTFEGTSIELGATARKPFSISVLGIKK